MERFEIENAFLRYQHTKKSQTQNTYFEQTCKKNTAFNIFHTIAFEIMGNLMCCIQESAASNDKQEEATPVTDRSANGLSYVGEACYQLLRTKHAKYHDSLWNVTKSKVVGSLQHTPGKSVFSSGHDPEEGHSNWFAEKMCEIMSKTTVWCDVMSLAAPDGYFLEQFQKALKTIADNNKDNSKPVIVRLMFGNIIGMYY